MATRKKQASDRIAPTIPGNVARSARKTLRTFTVGALPILDDLIHRLQLEQFLRAALPPEDRRTKLSPAKALLVLAAEPAHLARAHLRRRRVGRTPRSPIYWAWSRRTSTGSTTTAWGGHWTGSFWPTSPSLVLSVAAHAVKEFGISLDELHNDSTTVSFCGAYTGAAMEQRLLGRPTLAITFGHNKDHRPDLKQLLFILTVTADGGVPLHFRAESGNVVDDQNPPRHLGSSLPGDRPQRLPLCGRL